MLQKCVQLLVVRQELLAVVVNSFPDRIRTGAEILCLAIGVVLIRIAPLHIGPVAELEKVFISFLGTEQVFGPFQAVHNIPAQATAVTPVDEAYADSTGLERDYGFTPKIGIREGLKKFAEWYKMYYG